MMLTLHAIVFVALIATGVHFKGVAIGPFGGLGVLIFVVIFGLAPGAVPVSAILVILTIVTAAGAMQLAGGLDCLVAIGERLIRKSPDKVTYIAPLATYVLCAGAGTGNVFCSLLPVIYEVSYSAGVRPERPLALSATAGQLALTTSPASASMIAMVGLLAPTGFTFGHIIMIVLPASLLAIIAGAFIMNRIGKDLGEDPEFQRRCAEGLIQLPQRSGTANAITVTTEGKRSAVIFAIGILVIMVSGFTGWRPMVDSGQGGVSPLDTTLFIQMVMLATAALIVALCGVRASDIPGSPLFRLGLSAIVTLFGVAWMANTLLAEHSDLIERTLVGGLHYAPLMLGVGLFGVAAITTSQSSATLSIIPVGLAMGIPPAVLIALWPAVIGVFFLPANGSQFASVEIDKTGTTRIGAFVINHSFIPPVLVLTAVSVSAGLLIAAVMFH